MPENLEIPYGYCHCGCGEQVPVKRYIHGHRPRKFFKETLFIESGRTHCWEWQLGKCNGYGTMMYEGQYWRAHRFFYEDLVGPIPTGFVLDHLCENPSCVNPGHLEPVTASENSKRVHRGRTHCKRGHPFSPENTYRHPSGYRRCRICERAGKRARRERSKA